MGFWSNWFSGGSSDSSDAKFKTSQDGKDGSYKSERLTGTDKVHYHDISKTSTDGEHKEIYTPRSDHR